mmetsp:Transcript_36422/g.40944  ORF Transcript_36422/g.40944 Transcript_36422/m.40944 type:complete len:696 (+) Transcript_36422:167-2254(+)
MAIQGRIRYISCTMIVPSLWIAILVVSSCLFCTISADQQCISNINGIYDIEKDIIDTSIKRNYFICPNRRYKMGSFDFYSQKFRRGDEDKQLPLPLRPNMKIQCGDGSSRSCLIESGDLQVDGTGIRGLRDNNLDNVEIVGFVFEDAMKNSVWTTKPGSITFRNCEWTRINRSTSGPIILDYYDSFAKDTMLIVSFQDCRFHDNQFSGLGAKTALIVGNSEQNKLVFERTVFDNNNMQKNNLSLASRTHLIESLGPVVIENSCFVNNQVAAANVAIYGNRLSASDVVHVNDMGGSLCQFASVFKNYQQYQSLKPSCIPIDSSKVICNHLPSGRIPTPIKPVNQYVPFSINALQYDLVFENEYSILEGGCNREGIRPINVADAQNNEDSVCLNSGGCHISHSSSGEYLVYRFAHDKYFESINDELSVDVAVRVSSARRKEFRLELLYNEQVEASQNLYSEGLGYNEYTTITWLNIPLIIEEPVHSIRFWFVQGNINFCAISVVYNKQKIQMSTPLFPLAAPTPTPVQVLPIDDYKVVIPGIYSAMYYSDTDSFDKTMIHQGNCPFRKDSSIDAKINDDFICKQSIIDYNGEYCNIAFTEKNEYLFYDFRKEADQQFVKVSIRVASKRKRSIRVELYSSDRMVLLGSKVVKTRGTNSWNTYDTLVIWDQINIGNEKVFKMKIKFLEGKVNLCSFGIE